MDTPEPGDIVWCRFPERPRDVPGPKPRPVLVMVVDHLEDGLAIEVAYGTSQHLDRMNSGEFAIRKRDSEAAYLLAGLSYDTKFDLKHTLVLPWNDGFFGVAPMAPYGQNPKLGTLHPCLMKALEAAVRAASKK